MDVSRMELDLDNRWHILCSSPFNWLYDPGVLHFQYCRNALPCQSFGIVLAHCGHCWVLWACPLLVVLWILSRTDGEAPIEFANQIGQTCSFCILQINIKTKRRILWPRRTFNWFFDHYAWFWRHRYGQLHRPQSRRNSHCYSRDCVRDDTCVLQCSFYV